ncbi:uncharacterized protein LOC133720169 isoform X3 [Rosa rugosa]|uniref:uncharacterized protein LOC133720169 isoform X3 n=1 Tax=Rosa rugosa TaxID=74645 RepID=UPI002B40B840|nr:uncharacterized protein LOC133720169 isoform X3 [Rosa rugosa]
MEIEDVNMTEVVEQILTTLPPKTLMRFKCVSKRWHSLITNPRFVAKHLSISKHNNRSTPSVLLKRLVHKDNNTDSETQAVFSLLKFRNDIDGGGEGHSFLSGVEEIDIPSSMSLETRGSSLHIIGHCNEIICLVPAVSGEVILWNPAIHEFKPLPPQPYLPNSPEIIGTRPGWPKDVPYSIHLEYMDSLGFGYDPRSNDYKVVNIGYPCLERSLDGYRINFPLKTAVYTLSTDSWREMKTFSLETQSTILFPDRFQMYFKGMCYWSGLELHKEVHLFDAMEEESIRNIIILFDMGDEVFHDMLLPGSLSDPFEVPFNMHLLVWNESIALVGLQSDNSPYGVSFGIWVRDEFDGPKSPWTKHICFELTEKPLGFLNSDEILMEVTKDTSGRIFSYNLSTKTLKYLPIDGVQNDSAAIVYGNYSIVSILGGNKLENTDNSTNAGFSLFKYSFPPSHSMVDNEWHSYSVWAIPPNDVSLKIKKVMKALRLEFGGPEIEPHITVVGSIRMTHENVLNEFRSLQSCVTSGYKAKVNQVVIRSFYYQCVSLLIDSSVFSDDESFKIHRAAEACGRCFGFHNAVYTLSTDSWREMKTFSLETQSTILFPDRFQMYFKGMCYWSGLELHKEVHLFDAMEEESIRNIIILFDMGDEVFHDMLLPGSLSDPFEVPFNMHLLVWNESIALVGLQSDNSPYGVSFGIWVRDEFDGPKSPWTKHICFELTEKPLGFLNSDEILMEVTKDTSGRIFSYNLSTKTLKYLPIDGVQNDSAAIVYGNYSIVSILGGNKLENTDNSTNAGFSLFKYSFPPSHSMVDNEWHSYSVWAIPPNDVSLKIKKVMKALRLEFGGPEIEPHITVVGSIRMTHENVLNEFRSLQSCVTSGYKAKVNQVVIRSFYYQCVSLLIDSSVFSDDESFKIHRAAEACGRCFGFHNGVRPHLSLLYGNLTEEERRKAKEKVSILDKSITTMSFPITRLALHKIDYKDKTLKSWEKIAEYTLQYFD